MRLWCEDEAGWKKDGHEQLKCKTVVFIQGQCWIRSMAKKGGPFSTSTCTWASQGQDYLEMSGDTNPDF